MLIPRQPAASWGRLSREGLTGLEPGYHCELRPVSRVPEVRVLPGACACSFARAFVLCPCLPVVRSSRPAAGAGAGPVRLREGLAPDRCAQCARSGQEQRRVLQEFSGEVKARTGRGCPSGSAASCCAARSIWAMQGAAGTRAIAQLDPADLKLGQEALARPTCAPRRCRPSRAGRPEALPDCKAGASSRRGQAGAPRDRAEGGAAALDQARAQAAYAGQPGAVHPAGGGRRRRGHRSRGRKAEPGAVVAAGTPIVRVRWTSPRCGLQRAGGPGRRAARADGPRGAAGAAVGCDGEDAAGDAARLAAAADASTRTFVVRPMAGHRRAAPGPHRDAWRWAAAPRWRPPAAGGGGRAGRSQRGLAARCAGDDGAPAAGAHQRRRRQPGAGGRGLQPGQVVGAGVHVLTPGQKVRAATSSRPAPPRADRSCRQGIP